MTSELRCYSCGEPDSAGCQCANFGRVRAAAGAAGVAAEKHQRWITTKLAQAMAGCDCVDNVRVARADDMDQMADYARQFDNGCCGYYDDWIKHVDGTVYLIGFNHGH